jgi:hypothetical protein
VQAQGPQTRGLKILLEHRPEDPERIEHFRLPAIGDNSKKKSRGGPGETAGSDGDRSREHHRRAIAASPDLLAPLHPIPSSWRRSDLLLAALLVVARAPELRRPRFGRAAPAKKAKIRRAPLLQRPQGQCPFDAPRPRSVGLLCRASSFAPAATPVSRTNYGKNAGQFQRYDESMRPLAETASNQHWNYWQKSGTR